MCMGSETARKIGKKRYLYYVYYDNKQRKEVCCGPESDPRSEKKLKDVKLKDLQRQREIITAQINELKSPCRNKERVR